VTIRSGAAVLDELDGMFISGLLLVVQPIAIISVTSNTILLKDIVCIFRLGKISIIVLLILYF
jgi:hypothetical protein